MKRLVQLGAPYTLSSQIANLFREIDTDGSGSINYLELNAKLRSGNAIRLAEALRTGARGEIELRARNPRSLSHTAALPLEDDKPSRSPTSKGSREML